MSSSFTVRTLPRMLLRADHVGSCVFPISFLVLRERMPARRGRKQPRACNLAPGVGDRRSEFGVKSL
jgi:hypothetical protein